MRVHPAESATIQAVVANETDELRVRKGGYSVEKFVGTKQSVTAAEVSDQQFSVDEIVGGDFVVVE